MATTHSGRLVFPTNFGVPSANDIARHLGRECRWAGGTGPWWSVLHHIRVMHDVSLAEYAPGRLPSDVTRVVLMHDAHEAILRDVPATWKTDEQRAQERKLDKRLYSCYFGMDTLPDSAVDYVKELDLRCMRAEGLLVGPPDCVRNAGWSGYHEPGRLIVVTQAIQWLREAYASLPEGHDSILPGSPLVQWYVDTLRSVTPQHRWEAYGL